GSVAFVSTAGAVLEVPEGQEVVKAEDGKVLAQASDAGTPAPATEAPVMTLRALEVVLRPARGVEGRPQGTSRWKNVGTKDVVLAAGDAVRAKDHAAELAVGGMGLSLERGGELSLEPSSRPEGPTQVRLARGALTLTASGAGGSRVSIGGGTLQPKGAGPARGRRGGAGGELGGAAC